ncbi:hypothetical protein TVAG_482200 [Trichomonas vaginalis G3]|uniref:Uncharacterized protein n=1 Tax=Trichomonas vaginalis (strain ATCC PRA-98 / G3) TaxID=412133 RepID=A2EBM9_TRIV3|nr:hypothetical protein TVAGG3_0588660 [Trichomonas vaginalis G3]EAY09946.1 hypothetical protein TVAG_482200 [Trichomonas vaginalis G3]KAI5523087.1 hypothetical protein TVAGG3_0588660 [Trichomonas vaginalis G3]|eukprot:XP_001322169.1 hypothetical protein [Trichomonas vaginalis G3]
MKKWDLKDGRTLVLKRKTFRSRFMVKRFPLQIPYIEDGSNKIEFNKSMGKLELADGRIAYVGDDKYLRIMSDSIDKIEVYYVKYSWH